ncbi:LysR family transcriptional regulator [Nesterenkonia lutea]|uniref:DNA-binding transcriptional LysR family regulator n=1 Tax=Nesterenkonia lutea TaxID=272919 RepID=A0ABR9JGS7_9MICC|nr:LysR substrate-binding domain-containing protein [Nesterenkonia lutea]MBE1525143.1 DNA-binding transcriptional LysR family regulator [Nesterenkonia lutea]
MELRQLRYFVAVAEELHFGRAARRLHLSQSPLSAQILKLEQEIGHQLFHRTTRQVTLTGLGREFHRRVIEVLQAADELSSGLGGAAEGTAGQLRLGFVSSASYALLPRAIRRFREVAPQVSLQLEPLTSSEQAEALREGQLDLGIVRGADSAPELRTEELLAEEIIVCLPEDHDLAGRAEVSARELVEGPLIFFPPREMPGYAAEIRPIFEGLRFPPVYARIIQQETALGFVAAGLGYTLLPASVTAFAPPTICLASLSGRPRTRVYAAFSEHQVSPAAELFLSVLREVSAQLRS